MCKNSSVYEIHEDSLRLVGHSNTEIVQTPCAISDDLVFLCTGCSSVNSVSKRITKKCNSLYYHCYILSTTLQPWLFNLDSPVLVPNTSCSAEEAYEKYRRRVSWEIGKYF